MSQQAECGLPRRHRLRKRREFMFLQRTGTRGKSRCCTVVVRRSTHATFKVGFTVSKKVGNAVCRNLMKRRLRHIVRTQRGRCEGYEINVIAHPPAAEAEFTQLERDVWRSFRIATDKLKS